MNIPITLTPAEIALYKEGRLERIVRAAVECRACDGCGDVMDGVCGPVFECFACHGTGHYPCPLGQPGDVLEFQREWTAQFSDGSDMTYRATLHLTRTDEARLDDGNWIGGVE